MFPNQKMVKSLFKLDAKMDQEKYTQCVQIVFSLMNEWGFEIKDFHEDFLPFRAKYTEVFGKEIDFPRILIDDEYYVGILKNMSVIVV